jgi:hypothetical protein
VRRNSLVNNFWSSKVAGTLQEEIHYWYLGDCVQIYTRLGDFPIRGRWKDVCYKLMGIWEAEEWTWKEGIEKAMMRRLCEPKLELVGDGTWEKLECFILLVMCVVCRVRGRMLANGEVIAGKENGPTYRAASQEGNCGFWLLTLVYDHRLSFRGMEDRDGWIRVRLRRYGMRRWGGIAGDFEW